jgi:general secretion pathway protein K
MHEERKTGKSAVDAAAGRVLHGQVARDLRARAGAGTASGPLLPVRRSARATFAVNRRGSGLIVAIWVIALLSILVISFAFDAHLETKVLSVTRKRHQAEYLAMSGITIAELLMDKQGSVSGGEAPEAIADDRWYQPALLLKRGKPVSGLVEKLGGGFIRLDIEPEPGRRNVNRLIDDDWERILRVGGVPEELWPTLIDSFNDWVDKDDLPRQNGAETEDYYSTLPKPYRTRNGPVDTVRELLLVKGFNETILSGGVLNPDAPPEQRKVLSGIQDMLTTYGDGKVNVNAAGLRVLMTLSGVDDLVAHAIVEERERQVSESANGIPDTGFKSVADFLSRIPGLDPAVAGQVTVGSSVFRVTAIGQVGQVTRRIWAIAEWNSTLKKLKIMQWREET